ncbi:flavoprotein [Propionibacteriaceae bacterium Y1685]
MTIVGLVVTGTPLAGRAVAVADTLSAQSHGVAMLASAAARAWVPDVPTWLNPPSGRWVPSAVVVCPATFNTINAVASGLNHSDLLGVINEALVRSTPMLFVSTTAERMTRHPAWQRSVDTLTEAGVNWLDPQTGDHRPGIVPDGSASRVCEKFDPAWVTDWLER